MTKAEMELVEEHGWREMAREFIRALAAGHSLTQAETDNMRALFERHASVVQERAIKLVSESKENWFRKGQIHERARARRLLDKAREELAPRKKPKLRRR